MAYLRWSPRRTRRYSNRIQQQIERIRRASIVVMRGYDGPARRRSWVQDVNYTFARMYRVNHRTTFADALRAYADDLEANFEETNSVLDLTESNSTDA